MRTTRKIILALVLSLALVAVLSVCAFAFDITKDLPQGVTKDDARWVDSGYADVDNEAGWYMIGINGGDYSTTATSYPTFVTTPGGRFYWHKETNRAVWLVTSGTLSADWGEERVRTLDSIGDNRLYAFASWFVDETNLAENSIAGDFAAGKDEGYYRTDYWTYNEVIGGKENHPIYGRYLESGKAGVEYTNCYVSKSLYDGYIEYKKSLGYEETQNVTDVAHQDLLVEYAFKNLAAYKQTQNCLVNGAKFHIAWVFNQLEGNNISFKSVEFRTTAGLTATYRTVGLVTVFLEAEKILIDKNIASIDFSVEGRGLFIGNSSLKTFDHVTFNEDGTYTGDVVEGVVDLTGFTHSYIYSNGKFASEVLQNSGMQKVVWFGTIGDGNTEYAGIIDSCAFEGSKIVELVVPANVNLEAIRARAFSGCGALKTIDVKGSVSADMSIEASAFEGTSGITIKVYSDLDKANMEKALANAGVAGVDVVTTKVIDPSDGGAIANVITADGFMLRTSSYNGLRALFTFNEAKATEVAAESGYSLVEYGAIASSAASLEAAGSAENLFKAANGKSVQRIVIFADDGSGLNRYVDVDKKQYCIAVRDFEGANTLKDIYVAGYAVWSDGKDAVITFSEYKTKTGKNTISLYTLTLEMFKAGVINSQTVTDSVCLWDVLKNGAFSVTEADTKKDPIDAFKLDVQYTFDAEGKFTYVDLPLRAWIWSSTGWDAVGKSVEDVSTTNVLWSILVDGSDLIAVYRADPNVEGDAVIPGISAKYGACAPYSSDYFCAPLNANWLPETSKGPSEGAKLYSPVMNEANSAKVRTLVIDYGVDQIGGNSLGVPTLTTIVYPENIKAGSYALGGCSGLKNFVYATGNKSYLDDYNVGTLIDLTGISNLQLTGVLTGASAAENLLLPPTEQIDAYWQEVMFNGASSLVRCWTVGYNMPEAGTLDLSHVAIEHLSKGCFRGLDSIDDIILSDTFKEIAGYCLETESPTDHDRWHLFDNNSEETKYNIHVANWTGLDLIANKFYEARQNDAYNDGKSEWIRHIVDNLQITYEGETKTVLEWRANFPAQPVE